MIRALGLVLIVAISLFFLAGCESGAEFRVVNRTSYPLYVTLEGEEQVIIPGSNTSTQNYNEHVFDVKTGTKNIFTGEVKERLKVQIIGETFHIYDDDNTVYVDSTYITLKAGKKLNAYIAPNRASIKIINSSLLKVLNAQVVRDNYITEQVVGNMENIEPGTEKFIRVDYATPSSQFFYRVRFTMEDGTQFEEGNQQNILYLDNQFLIILGDSD